ncbi:zinc finger protein 501-like [Branchiostoma lanceolatum]|uniref:zinc finger protein 501-like n=1 Tax=Branchiostoma lanceolatum TaxID=7740 RepID=UPI0034540DCE
MENPIDDLSTVHPGNETNISEKLNKGRQQDRDGSISCEETCGVKYDHSLVQGGTEATDMLDLKRTVGRGRSKIPTVQHTKDPNSSEKLNTGMQQNKEEDIQCREPCGVTSDHPLEPRTGSNGEDGQGGGETCYMDKRIPCTECDFRAASKSDLSKHIRRHTGEKPYKCDQCEYSASQKGNLVRHMEIHTGEKPYMCGECRFRTADRSSLSRHMKMHTGVKSYKCDQCKYTCMRKDTLDKHMAKHNGEKLNTCEECGYRTARMCDFSRHMKKHTGEKPYKCVQCDYSSTQKGHLKRHMAKHSVEKPYTCGECGFRTAERSYLSRHMRTHVGAKS